MSAVIRLVGIAGAILSGLITVLAVILSTIFWVLDRERTVRSLLLFLPSRKRQQTRELFESIETRVGAYLRSQALLCFLIGTLAFIAYLALGLPNAFALALLAGVFEAVPIFGPILGAIPAILVAFSIEPMLAVWVLLATGIIQGLENYVFVPRLMGAAVGVNPIITLLSLATMTSLLGLPGGLIAIPLAAVIQLLWDRFVITTDPVNGTFSAGRDINSALRFEAQDLIADIRKHLRKKDIRSDAETDQVEDAIEALAIDIDGFLDQELTGRDRS
jgi:predicted PurR-regulated permease PerM